MSFAATATVGAGAMSAISGRKAAKDAKKQAQIQRAIANNSFSPVDVNMPGGANVTFGGGGGGFTEGGERKVPGGRGTRQSDLGTVNIDLGDQEQFRQGLTDMGGAQMQNIWDMMNNPNGAMGSFNNFMGQGMQSQQALQGMMGQGQQAMGGAFGNLMNQQQNPFGGAMQGQVMGQAGNAFANVAGTQQEAFDRSLSAQRSYAQPFEDRAFSKLQDSQFATGQSGTSGGGLQTEAFARGLGQADISRQLAAGAEGRAAQNQQMGMAQGFLGAGQGMAGMQDQLLSGATNRFNQMGQFNQGLQGQNFNQAQGMNQAAMGNQGFQMQQLMAMLGGVQGLNQEGRQNAQLANQFMSGQANSRLGAASVGMPQDNSQGTMWAQLAGSLAPPGGVDFGGLFGGIKNMFTGGGGGSKTVGQFGVDLDRFVPGD